jgi:NADP-dependent 3-hydroxy acid dehydrogenase YdfG
MTSDQTLSGKTAVVTGASSGIGRAIAEKLGASGAHVYLAGRTASAMDDSKGRIEAAGGKATPVVADLRDVAQVQGLVERASADTGRLDIMVNNAAVRAMRKVGSQGHIVNISSVAALRPDSGVYGSTKHAVNTISNTLRAELEGDSIRVVTIMPGAIATNFGRNFDPAVIANIVRASGVEVDVKRGERLPDEVFDKMAPMMKQTLGSPEDIANAVLYAVTQPIEVNVAEMVVRPPRQLAL